MRPPAAHKTTAAMATANTLLARSLRRRPLRGLRPSLSRWRIMSLNTSLTRLTRLPEQAPLYFLQPGHKLRGSAGPSPRGMRLMEASCPLQDHQHLAIERPVLISRHCLQLLVQRIRHIPHFELCHGIILGVIMLPE
jgi:hypothetical protein